MTVKARIEVAAMPSVTPLYRDFVSRGGGPIQSRLPSFHAGDAWSAGLARRVSVAAGLLNAVRDYNVTLGVRAATIERLKGLADGSVRAIVTGQQPGVLGGPLMSLYKAATTIAVAREIEARHGRPCVPVFWLGADDDDFAEVRELSVLASDYSRLDVSLDASAYRPGLRVGDMNPGALRAVWSAVSPSLPTGPAHDHLSAAVLAAGDFADGAARALVAATGGGIVMVDARAPQLKEAGRDLLLSFYDRESELRALLEADSVSLERDGYHAQVQWGQDSGLFVVEDGVRQRVPGEQRDRVRIEIERDISTVAPGVIARNLLQDSVLAPLAVVLGPAEIAYRAQMTGIYRALGVAMPVVAPRLSATYLPPAVRDMLGELGVDAAGVAADAARVAAAVSARGGSDGIKQAAAALEASFKQESDAFRAQAASRLDDRARAKLDKRFDELAGRLAQALVAAIEQDVSAPRARWPFLARMADMFERNTEPQERFLSLVTPMLFHGDDAWRAIDACAGDWTRDALDGRVWHVVYSV